MFKKWIVLFLAVAFLLTACNSPVFNQTEGNIADVVTKTAAARHKFDDTGKPKPPLVVKPGSYVDTTPISLEKDPGWLNNHIVIRGDQLPFSYYSRTIAAGAGNNILTKYQVGLDPSTNITISYTGTIRGALDLLASRAGFVYSIHTNSIYWQAFVTRTFDVAFMPGGTDYLMGKSSSSGTGATPTMTGGGGGGGNGTGTVANYTTSDSSDSEYSSLKGTLSIWKDLDSTIRQLLSPEGKVMVSESTTSVTVRDRPSNVHLIGQYIYNLNQNLAKQVLVKIQVLEIKLTNGYDFGINWQLIARAFHNTPFVVNGNYGTPVAIQALTPQPTINGAQIPVPEFGFNAAQNPGNPNGVPSYTILLNALNQQGKTSVVSEPRVICLNNQVSVIRIVQQLGYVASIQNTSLAGSATNISQNTVTSQVTPGSLITGLTLYILPKILNDKIFLQVNADLSTNNGFNTFGPTNATIQLPNITEKSFNQRSMIRSGDTLILSGFRQIANQTGANQFLTYQALGGKASQVMNTETIVLITPFVLNGSA